MTTAVDPLDTLPDREEDGVTHVSRILGERVEHVESMHVDDGRIDDQMFPTQTHSHHTTSRTSLPHATNTLSFCPMS